MKIMDIIGYFWIMHLPENDCILHQGEKDKEHTSKQPDLKGNTVNKKFFTMSNLHCCHCIWHWDTSPASFMASFVNPGTWKQAAILKTMLTLWSWTYWPGRDRGWRGGQSWRGRCRGGRRRRPRTWWQTWRREGRWRGWRGRESAKVASRNRTLSNCLQKYQASWKISFKKRKILCKNNKKEYLQTYLSFNWKHFYSQMKKISLEEPRKTVLGWGRFRISTLNGSVLWFSFLGSNLIQLFWTYQ